jgi:regulatory factor X, other
VNVPWEVECVTVYGDLAARQNRPSGEEQGNGESPRSNVLDRWVHLLRELPKRFPYASHMDIVWCVERVGTAVMRDLTLAQGKSFGSWWVTKAWIDEMACFLAEQGGFMKPKKTRSSVGASRPQPAIAEVSRQKLRCSSGSENLDMPNISHAQSDRAPFPPPSTGNHAPMAASGNDVHDDSGIGIRTPEEEFPIDKFTFAGAETPNLEGADVLGAGEDL